MIIDVTNTIGRHKFKPEITADNLIEQMDANGIDMAVIHCYAEYIDNESVYNAVQKYPDRFIGLYTVNPWDDDAPLKLEDAFNNKGFKGLYLNPLRQGFMLCERDCFYPLLKICEKYNAAFFCYGGAQEFCCPVFFNKIADDFPKVNIILSFMGIGYDTASAVVVAKEHPNVYLETSGGMDFHAHRAMKTSGIDKVMMGTGTPDCNYYEFELLKVRNAAKIYPDGEAKVLYKNACKVFNIQY